MLYYRQPSDHNRRNGKEILKEKLKMFYCIATKALKDGTQGFRFNVCGVKGLTRKRLFKRRWGIAKGKSMVSLHIGKRSVYIERKTNKTKGKRIRHFAG